jgi:tetratricopeptide (TPR) repeat protein
MEQVHAMFPAEEPLDPQYELLKELGDCHMALAHHDRARECYEEAARVARHKPGPHVGRGVVALQTGSLEEAARAFGQALRIDDRCAAAYAGLGMVAQQQQDFARAFDLYMKALDSDVNNLVALLGLFQASVQMGTFSRIIHYLVVYLDRHPDDIPILFCLATLYARDNRMQEAHEILHRLLDLDPDHAEAAMLLKDVQRKRQEAGTATP